MFTDEQQHHIEAYFPGIRIQNPRDGLKELMESLSDIDSSYGYDFPEDIERVVYALSERLSLLGVRHSIRSKSIFHAPIVVATDETYPKIRIITKVPVIVFSRDGTHEFNAFLQRGLSLLDDTTVIFDPCFLLRYGARALYSQIDNEIVVPFSVALNPADVQYSKRITLHEIRHAHAHVAGVSALTVEHCAGLLDAKTAYDKNWTSCESEVQYAHGIPQQDKTTSERCLENAQRISGHSLLILNEIIRGIIEHRHPLYKILKSNGAIALRFLIELRLFEQTDFSKDKSVFYADIEIRSEDFRKDLISRCKMLLERQKNVFDESSYLRRKCPVQFMDAVNEAVIILNNDLEQLKQCSESIFTDDRTFEKCSKWSYVAANKRNALFDPEIREKVIQKTLEENDTFFVNFVLSHYSERKFCSLRGEIASQWISEGWGLTDNVLMALLESKPENLTYEELLDMVTLFQTSPCSAKFRSQCARFFANGIHRLRFLARTHAVQAVKCLCRDTRSSAVDVGTVSKVLQTYKSVAKMDGLNDVVENIEKELKRLKRRSGR